MVASVTLSQLTIPSEGGWVTILSRAGQPAQQRPMFLVEISFPTNEQLICPVASWDELPDPVTGHAVIIGRDILERTLLVYNGPTGQFTLAL